MGIGWEENAAKMVMTTRDYNEVLTHSPTTVPSFLFSKKGGGNGRKELYLIQPAS